MTQCSYIYASGLRIESGKGTVELDGKTLRVIRNGKGKSRLDRPLGDPPSDGEITLKDLQAELAKRGETTAKLSVVAGGKPFSVTLEPAEGMGRSGRQGDFKAAFAAMPPEERTNAALYQLHESLPYSDKSSHDETAARLAAVLEIVDVAQLTKTLPAEFGLYASREQMQKAIAAASVEDAVRFASPVEFDRLVTSNPREAIRFALSRMSRDQFVRAVRECPEEALSNAEVRNSLSQHDFDDLVLMHPELALEHASDRLSKDQRVFVASDETTRAQLETADMKKINRYFAALDESESVAILTALAADKVPGLRATAASNPAMPPEVLVQLSRDEKAIVRAAAGGNRQTPAAELTLLALDGKPAVRAAVAGNSATPLESLTLLVEDKKSEVRQAVAGNTNTSSASLASLAVDEEKEVRAAVAGNVRAPAIALAALAAEKDETIRQSVASNKATPYEALAVLATDGDDDVRRAVAMNQSTPPLVLQQMAEDDRFYGLADRLLHAKGEEVESGNRRSRAAAIVNPALPVETLIKLSTEDRDHTRAMVARNISTPPEVLDRLSLEKDFRIRAEVAKNPSAQPGALARLASDKDPRVREFVANHQSTPPEAFRELSKYAGLAETIAGNPATPVDVLQELAKSTWAPVPRAVADNPSTPPALRDAILNGHGYAATVVR